jgi:glutamate dehydrogenase
MPLRAEEADAALIVSVCSLLPDHVPPESVGVCDAFVRQFYHWMPPEDLAARSARDLYGAAIAAWQFAGDRTAGSAHVRAYNPTADEHGWQSANTAVEVITEDMPFLADSVDMELSRRGYAIRLSIVVAIDVVRDSDGRLLEVFAPGAGPAGAATEAVMQIEVDRETDPDRIVALVEGIGRVLRDVTAAVTDWPTMRSRIQAIRNEFLVGEAPLDPPEAEAVGAFLDWVDDGNFIFLGYREYDLVSEAGEDLLHAVDGSGLGLLRERIASSSLSFARLPADVRSSARAREPLILTKANSRSTVHRPLYLDYIGVKRFEGGEVRGERRFLGLYTSAAEQTSPRRIPILRDKVEHVISRAGFPPDGHKAKALARTLESYPRDELLQISEEELFTIAMGIVALGERQQVRLFARTDPYRRFVSCLVFVPRDRFNTDNRERIESVLRDALGASEIDWAVRLSERALARIHYTARGSVREAGYDFAEIERRIAQVTRPWVDDLAVALRDQHGDEEGNALLRRYRSAFPIAYRADWPARVAIDDIDRAEALAVLDGIMVSVYHAREGDQDSVRIKLLSPGERIALSDILPILENMGLRAADERPYEIRPENGRSVWLYDIGVIREPGVDLESEATRSAFEDAFTAVWRGEVENDRLGALVLRGGLTGREVSLLRAFVKYLRQAGTTFSDSYLQQALTANPGVARSLVELFGARLDPERHDPAVAERVASELARSIEQIGSVDHARILRDCRAVVQATVRTNYFQRSADGEPRAALSLKLEPSLLPFLPAPRPRLETFVYSPGVEGVYLRSGYVARGGVRRSDRREDFRAEAVVLIRAETLRNAVVVPVGAKGAFVVKRPLSGDQASAGAVAFVSALLDVTDNVVGGRIVTPAGVIRHDADDAYLVLAPDEGTESLAGLARELASEYGFWLGDSFAVGGNGSYDQREMGITALGTWESVTRHLRGLGVAVESVELTVIGIGEVSDEAFGNGVLLSPHLKLIAAFGGKHVFLDPNPDPERSFAERRRLFELPGASWADYDPAAISEGGGVFARSVDEIPLSAQVRDALDTDAHALTADELIRVLLRAPVDLLWSGGRGTFVKSASEANADIADKVNDDVRVDGAELRCRVVGEVAAGGFTQRGRIEYALSGGRINTDTIDSAAGVSRSDDEVNLKLLLDAAATDGEITGAERGELLAGLVGSVAARVLDRSYAQALALSLERGDAPEWLDLQSRQIAELERRGIINRELDAMPSEERLRNLKAVGEGLTSPELAMLLGYTKIALSSDLLASDVPDDDYLRDRLVQSLPEALGERFRPQMRRHPLRREIIVTDLANDIVDHQGTTFVFRLAEETGAGTAHIARAYAVADEVLQMRGLWREIREREDRIDDETQFKLLLQGRRLVTRSARWLVQNRRRPLDIAAAIADYGSGAAALREALPELLSATDPDAWHRRVSRFSGPGVPPELAARVAAMDALFFVFDVVESVRGTDTPVRRAAAVHFGIDRRLELAWLRDRILALPRADIWQTQARARLRDNLYRTHRALTARILAASPAADADRAIEDWTETMGDTVARYLGTLAEIRSTSGDEFTTLLVLVRRLASLTAGG